jgi:hypothetical protein
MCTFGWKIKRTLNDKTIKCHNKKKNLDFFIKRKILTLHLINYIDLNGSLHHVINLKCPNYNCSIVIYLTLSMDGPNLDYKCLISLFSPSNVDIIDSYFYMLFLDVYYITLCSLYEKHLVLGETKN